MKNYNVSKLNNIEKTMNGALSTMNDKEAHYKKMNNYTLYDWLYKMSFVLVILFLVCN